MFEANDDNPISAQHKTNNESRLHNYNIYLQYLFSTIVEPKILTAFTYVHVLIRATIFLKSLYTILLPNDI